MPTTRRRPPPADPIDDARALARFMDGGAAAVAEAALARLAPAGRVSEAGRADAALQARLSAARAEIHAAALAEIGLIVEAFLRPLAQGEAPALAGWLRAAVAATLAGRPRPTHRADGWASANDAFAERLGLARIDPPRPAADIARAAAMAIAGLLPAHALLPPLDRRRAEGSIQLAMIQVHEALIRRARPEPLVLDVVAAAPRSPG